MRLILLGVSFQICKIIEQNQIYHQSIQLKQYKHGEINHEVSIVLIPIATKHQDSTSSVIVSKFTIVIQLVFLFDQKMWCSPTEEPPSRSQATIGGLLQVGGGQEDS